MLDSYMGDDMGFVNIANIIELTLRGVCLLIFLYMVYRVKLIEVQLNQKIVGAEEII